jgi:TPR repeat protein
MDRRSVETLWHSFSSFWSIEADLRDLEKVVQCLKCLANEGNADGQWLYVVCLQLGEGIVIDLRRAAEYFRLSADRSNAFDEYHYTMCLVTGSGV